MFPVVSCENKLELMIRRALHATKATCFMVCLHSFGSSQMIEATIDAERGEAR
jgi:hypothetical protein